MKNVQMLGQSQCIMTPDIASIRRYIAFGSVGASTVRGLRKKGVVAAARNALAQVRLEHFATNSDTRFRNSLDAETERVRRALPNETQFWGVARKVLNIFLRGSLYNTYLNAHYKLSPAERCFEIPLDSLSASGIRRETLVRPRPRWVGVKHVTPAINDVFQALAAEIAAARQTVRVHLDAVFWVDR